MKNYFLLSVFLCICFLLTPDANAGETKQTVYVWTFSMRDRTHTVTTDNLTDEFEQALSDAQKYSVLERRSADELVKQGGIEEGITDAKDIPETAKSALQLQGADMVIIGKVTDDLSGGVYTVTVTFEDWKGVKHLIKDIDIPRDQIADKSARRQAMADLVQKIIRSAAPVSVLKADIHSFLVEVTKCQSEGEDVTVDLSVTDNDDTDRWFGFVIAGWSNASLMYDDSGNKAIAKYARVANQEGTGGIVRSQLISGTPVKCVLEFGHVPQNATSISRLVMSLVGGRQSFTLTLKNIPIER